MIFLSIDFGTSAIKAALMDGEGNILCHSKEEYSFIILPGEKYELPYDSLWTALKKACAGLDPAFKEQVEVLCYDTFSPSPVFLDDKGEPVYPNIITHLDRRSREQTREISESFGNDAYMKISGIYPFPGGCSAMTFLWFVRHMPEVLEKSCTVGHLPTYIHYQFTGKRMVDFVNASMMGLYETTTQGTWSETLLKAFGLPERIFPEIMIPGKIFGSLLEEPARLMGVKAGIPVAVGANDVSVAQVGAGNRTSGCILNSTGSSEMVSILSDQAVIDPCHYLRNASIPGLWQIYATTCGGFGLDWFYREFCREMTKDEYYAYLAEEIRRFLAEGNGEVTFDPYLAGDRQSLEKRTAAWHGLTLGSTRGQMLAALLVSIQDVIYGTISRAAEKLELNTLIKASGGMLTDAYLQLKKELYPQYSYELVDDGPIRGNVELVKMYMN